MQKIVYTCDGCNRPCGNKPHLSIMINGGKFTGVALPPESEYNDLHYWRVEPNIKGTFHHFHNGTCAGKYFDAKIAEAVKRAKEDVQNPF